MIEIRLSRSLENVLVKENMNNQLPTQCNGAVMIVFSHTYMGRPALHVSLYCTLQ